MNRPKKYDVSGLVEGQYEPGSHSRVLRNLLGIKHKREMDELESEELKRTTGWAIENFHRDQTFTAEDIRLMHKNWLEGVYQWAGQYRQVMMSKAGLPFAAPAQIPKLMNDLEIGPLRRYTPCHGQDITDLTEGMAVVHTELLLIHPFREGNGRIARLLAMLMGLQANLPLFDFSQIKGKKKTAYFSAVRAGLDMNYKPMQEIFREVITWSLRSSGKEPS